jgi:hypothetical protein
MSGPGRTTSPGAPARPSDQPDNRVKRVRPRAKP